jgi:hypothetical protein
MITQLRFANMLSAFTILAGSVAIALTPKAAIAAAEGCEFCWDQCPPDIGEFCQSVECSSGQGSGCQVDLCQDVGGSWWAYAISC